MTGCPVRASRDGGAKLSNMAGDEEAMGGDAACWLDRVCPDCGSFVALDQPHHCAAGEGTTDAVGNRRPSTAPGVDRPPPSG